MENTVQKNHWKKKSQENISFEAAPAVPPVQAPDSWEIRCRKDEEGQPDSFFLVSGEGRGFCLPGSGRRCTLSALLFHDGDAPDSFPFFFRLIENGRYILENESEATIWYDTVAADAKGTFYRFRAMMLPGDQELYPDPEGQALLADAVAATPFLLFTLTAPQHSQCCYVFSIPTADFPAALSALNARKEGQ